MTKYEFFRFLAQKWGMTQQEADLAYNKFMEVIWQSLKADGAVKLPGLGKFVIQERAARTGRNPRTGEAIQIPAKRAIKFTPASNLEDEVCR